MQEQRLGTIVEGQVILNDAGVMVAATRETNIGRYPSAALDAFVVMPNQMHAIVFLGVDSELSPVPTLGRIAQTSKSITTVEYTRQVRGGVWPPFDQTLWQRGFHDRIIRSDRELEAKRAYVEGNPGRWQDRNREA